ncbi:tyrosine-type recombinase/integrase [Duganella sp. FT3S]|uniref:Tyrosine-type recombinase/integrase n=1 Tax=Rugamonas fusca TaxID=2758568 RepID=A0A7W2ELD3_9BURK|nr:site-specific integrase [Rugamonas fusca]MBA5608064.1 tyrosine-type recombinase/integrase [Rugamonas fusca]
MATIEKRVGGDGAVTYRVKVRLKGHAPETASFDRRTDAKEWAQRIEADIKAGRHFGTSKRHTLAELLDRYEQSELSKLKSARTVKAKLDWWRRHHGEKMLSEMTRDIIAKARDDLQATPKQRGSGQRSAADVNRTLAALSSVCSFAVKELGWLDRNPLELVNKPSENKGRVRFLSSEELPRFLQACRESTNSHLYLAVVLALTTGARQSEVMGLRWPQIDFARRTALLGDSKNGDARSLPLSGDAIRLLRERATVVAVDDNRLFPPKQGSKSPYLDLRAPFKAALNSAGIVDFHWHDLRHTAASYLAMAGTSPLMISKILGQRTMAMVARYSHLAPESVVELGDLLATRMGVE